MAELKLQQRRLDGRYDVLECLGRGSYAEIYVAKDNAALEAGPTTVVIKALNVSLQEAPDDELERTLVANFQNEAVALDRVRHPHIISRLGHGTAIDLEGTTFHYIVLEYLPGGDMSVLTRNHPLPIKKALFYLEQVCSGLVHAHSCGVIHRDIKPHNLLLTSDKQVVKIADFGVARMEATEGVITRVGTNIYAAPEHNPLVQTSQLDTGALVASREQLTFAADVYSLAKATYTLLTGESPRRFAQHAITGFPAVISGEYWSAQVLRVLEKATQTRPENRYQRVTAFWEELADAALPPTQQLTTGDNDAKRRPSADLALEREELTQAPPQARFELKHARDPVYPALAPVRRPKIVVPVASIQGAQTSRLQMNQPRQQMDRRAPISAHLDPQQGPASSIVRSGAEQPRNGKALATTRQPATASRTKRLLVALVLILCFSGMLLATHKYVTSRWNPLIKIPQLSEMFVVGREGVTTTDVNLRTNPGATNTAIGLAEFGSRVRVLSVADNWYEVQVVSHGRDKTEPFSSDRGWLNKRFVKFD
jgi:serine/threonine protein kinase